MNCVERLVSALFYLHSSVFICGHVLVFAAKGNIQENQPQINADERR